MDEGITRWSKRGALVLLGWFASSAYHQTLDASRALRKLPVVQAELGCEHNRAENNEQVAKQAILSAQSEDAVLPSPGSIQRDCPKPSETAQK